MEPLRILVIEPVALHDGQELQPWSYVWKLGSENNGMILIEYRNREYKIPARQTVETPVAAPSTDRLIELDPCFAALKENLQEVHRNESFWFSVYRCPHGNYFLEDVRGGIAVYSHWIFLGQVDDLGAGNLKTVWSRYHTMPSDAIFHLGIGY